MHTGGSIMDEKREVIKHSAAIHIQNNITLLQRRAWNVLLHNAYDDLLSDDEYRITVKTLTQIEVGAAFV
jgi:truncated hemoglobin YjbI